LSAPGSPAIIAGFTLAAATFQLLAAVFLELAEPRTLAAAIARGPFGLFVFAGGGLAAGVGLYALRRRPNLARIYFVTVIVGTLAYLRARVGVLPLAVYGEPIAYHFLALVSFGLILRITGAWAKRPELGSLRFVPLLVAGTSALGLLLEHLGGEWEFLAFTQSEALRGGVRACALTSWGFAAWV